MEIDLDCFTDSTQSTYDLSKPFFQSERVIASDGKKLVIVDKEFYQGGVLNDINAKVPNCASFVNFKFDDLKLKTLPKIEKPHLLNNKWQLELDDLEVTFRDCYECGNEDLSIFSITHIKAFARVRFDGFDYHAMQLWAMNLLPGIVGSPIRNREEHIDGMLACKFDAGTAFLMPLREDPNPIENKVLSRH